MFPNRDAGFNFTEDAKTTIAGESINPAALVASVQARKEDTYTEKYLDYYFELSKQDLATIKNFTKTEKGNNYSEFPGEINKEYLNDKNDRRSVYTSPLIVKLGAKVKVNPNTRYKVYGH